MHQKQQKTMTCSQFTIFGSKYPMGSYILFIRISSSFQLAFGRFQHSRLFTLPVGDYLYIGSALGSRGNPLARRLIRHASRSKGVQPHEIQASLIQFFSENDASLNSANTFRSCATRLQCNKAIDPEGLQQTQPDQKVEDHLFFHQRRYI